MREHIMSDHAPQPTLPVEKQQWTAQSNLDTLSAHREQLRAFGVLKLGLFGSYARDEQTPDSDMDFLVVMERYTLRNFVGFADFLEALFGCEVDLVPENHIKPRLRPYIMKDVIYVEGL